MKITLNGQTYDVLFFPTSRVTLLPAVCIPSVRFKIAPEDEACRVEG